MNRSRVRGPYARFCERDEVSIDQLTSPYSIFLSFFCFSFLLLDPIISFQLKSKEVLLGLNNSSGVSC